MPLPKAEALILLDPRLDKQGIYQVGKIASKLCEEKQTCIQALLDVTMGDSATIVKTLNNCKNLDELKETFGKLAFEIGLTNTIDTENNLAVFLAGYGNAKQIKEYKEKIDLVANAADSEFIKSTFPSIAKKKKKVPKKGYKRYYLTLKGPNNGCDVGTRGRIVNKQSNYHFNESLKLNGGDQTLILDCESIESKTNFQKLMLQISKYKTKIIFLAILGSTIYLLFKKQKFVKKFLIIGLFGIQLQNDY